MRIVYIAGPYRAPSYNEIEANIRRAEAAAIALWDKGYGVFCPHLNTSHFEVKSTAPAEAYLEVDLKILKACTDILMLPGWMQSEWAQVERNEALRWGLKVWCSVEELEAL